MNRTALMLSCLSLVLALGVAAVALKLRGAAPRSAPVWTHQDQRTLAARLKSVGLADQAISAYERCAENPNLERPRLATLAYSLGKMHLEQGHYEQALTWLYRVEIADPDFSDKTGLSSAIVTCLERAGKHSAADYALDRRSRGTAAPPPEDSPVVARINEEPIYRSDIIAALDRLPPWLRGQFETDGQKEEFLKKYVADELLSRKARKLGYDRDPAVRRQLARIERELLANRVMTEEIQDTVSVTEQDVRAFFQANPDRYRRTAAVRVRMIKAGLPEVAEAILDRLQGGEDFAALAAGVSLDNATARNGGLVPGWVRAGQDDLGIGDAARVTEMLLQTPTGRTTDPIEAGGYHYIFRVEEKRPERMPTFEDVADQVRQDCTRAQMETAYRDLLEQTLRSTEVQLFPEALREARP